MKKKVIHRRVDYPPEQTREREELKGVSFNSLPCRFFSYLSGRMNGKKEKVGFANAEYL